MTTKIVLGRRFSERPAPKTLVLSGRGRQRGWKTPKAEPARPNSRPYDWGDPLPRPAWREVAEYLLTIGLVFGWLLLCAHVGLAR